MKNNKKFINTAGFLGSLILGFLFSSFSYAEGTCPISISPIQSSGVLVYNTDSPVAFYTSDLTNITWEIENLGIYTDGKIDEINTNIDTLTADVSTGKTNVATEINKFGGSISLSDGNIPSFDDLQSNIQVVYTAGYNKGVAKSVPSTGSIVYTYHHHCISGSNVHASDSTSTGGNSYGDSYVSSSKGGCFQSAVPKYHSHVSSCYGTCGGSCRGDSIPAHGGYINGEWYSGDGSGDTDYVRVCTKCGHVSGRGNGGGEKTCSQTVVICGKTTSTVESYTYKRSCGYTANQIMKANVQFY